MEAIELLNELEDQGLSLKAKRDRLLVMPSKKITESTRSLIRQNKAELLRLIKPACICLPNRSTEMPITIHQESVPAISWLQLNLDQKLT